MFISKYQFLDPCYLQFLTETLQNAKVIEFVMLQASAQYVDALHESLKT